MTQRSTALVLATALIIASLAVLLGSVFMALAMGGDMGSHMAGMMGGGASSQPPAISEQSSVTIEMTDYDFTPRNLSIRAGTRVTWINRGAIPHTATLRNGGWDTGVLKQGESKTLTFDEPGTYQYLCTIHPNMQGTLTVR